MKPCPPPNAALPVKFFEVTWPRASARNAISLEVQVNRLANTYAQKYKLNLDLTVTWDNQVVVRFEEKVPGKTKQQSSPRGRLWEQADPNNFAQQARAWANQERARAQQTWPQGMGNTQRSPFGGTFTMDDLNEIMKEFKL